MPEITKDRNWNKLCVKSLRRNNNYKGLKKVPKYYMWDGLDKGTKIARNQFIL